VSDRRSLGRLAAYGVLGAIWLALAIRIIATSDQTQWDFKVYYHAANAWAVGLDPYDLQSLSDLSGEDIELPYVYPPGVLCFFRLFSWMPYEIAARVWVLLKLAALAALAIIWRRCFLQDVDGLLFAIVLLLGFSATVVWDLRSGNVSILEQLLLWTGFLNYLRDRRVAAAAFIGLASVFKLTPIIFLGLLLLPRCHPRTAVMALVTGLVVCLLCLAPLAWQPHLAQPFVTNAVSVTKSLGPLNPCVVSVIDWLGRNEDSASWLQRSPLSRQLLLAGYVLVILGFSIRPFICLVRQRDQLGLIVLSALIYALLLPRFQIYNYILLIPPACLLVHAVRSRISVVALLAILLCLQGRAGGYDATLNGLLWSFGPWMLALGLWLMCITGPGPFAASKPGQDDESRRC